jgi:hypothetical protein
MIFRKLARRRMAIQSKDLRPIGDDPEFTAASKLLADLKTEQGQLRRTITSIRDAAYLRSQAETGLSDADALTRAQALLAGESIDFRDGPAKIREAEARLAIVDPAIREASRRFDMVRDKLSNEAAASLRTRHRKAKMRTALHPRKQPRIEHAYGVRRLGCRQDHEIGFAQSLPQPLGGCPCSL